MTTRWTASLALPLLGLAVFGAQAEPVDASLRIKNHRFQPAQLQVPAGRRIKLVVHNDDASPEEFESQDLRLEKIITGNNRAVIHISPLEAGEYGFFGEFNKATAQGRLIAR